MCSKSLICFIGLFIYGLGNAQTVLPVLGPARHHSAPSKIVFTSDGDLISAGMDGSILFWDSRSKEAESLFPVPPQGINAAIYALAFNKAEDWLAVGGYPDASGTSFISIIDAKSERVITRVATKLGIITSVSIRDNYLVAGDKQGVIQFFDATNLNQLLLLGSYQHSAAIRSLNLSPEGPFLAIGSDEHFGSVVDFSNPEQVKLVFKLSKHHQPINKIQYSQDGRLIFTAGSDGFIHAFSAEGKHQFKLDHFDSPVVDFDISDDGKLLAAIASVSGTARTYNLESRKLYKEFLGYDNTGNCISISSWDPAVGYRVVSSGGDNHQILIWNPYIGTIIDSYGINGMTIWDLDFQNDQLQISLTKNGTYYDKGFDFQNQILHTSSTSLRQNKNPTDQTNYQLSAGRTKIINNPKTDGRLLSYLITDSLIAIGSDFSLKLYNSSNGKLISNLIGHSGGVRALAISKDGNYLASGGEDQIIHLWRLKKKDMAPFISLYLTSDDEWVCWTEQAYFNASSKGDQLLWWTLSESEGKTNTYFQASQFFNFLYRPMELAQSFTQATPISEVLASKGIAGIDVKSLNRTSAIFFNKPFAIVSNQGDRGAMTKTQADSYISEYPKSFLNVEVQNGGGGIDEIRIYQNEKLTVSETISTKDTAKLNRNYEVKLIPGVNKFKAVVINRQGVESYPAYQEMIYTGEVKALANLYIFNVGINLYKNPGYNLNYAVADASAFVETLKTNAAGIFDRVEVFSLYNENSTRTTILETFEKVQKQAEPQDVFVFYYAGHGVMDSENGQEYYLVPFDVTQLYSSSQIRKMGISSAELRRQLALIQAQKQLIVLDACQSGGAIQSLAMRGSPEEKAIVQLARSSGTVLLSASGSDQYAVEFEKLNHGVFTYAMIEALNGKADGGSLDKKITVNEIKSYLEDRVPELSTQYGGNTQFPTGFSSGQDFPISVVK